MEEKKLPIFSDKEPSDEFYTSFCHAGSTTEIMCEACGRVHYSDEGDHDPGRYEELERLQKQKPDKYIWHSSHDDSIGWMNFEGKQIVFECPCNYARAIEMALRRNEDDIISFFNKITKDRLDTAHQKREAVEKVLQERKI